MTVSPDFEIVRRTALPGDRAVVTARSRDPNAIRQFRTFAVLPTMRFAQNISDSVSIGAALHRASATDRAADGIKGSKAPMSKRPTIFRPAPSLSAVPNSQPLGITSDTLTAEMQRRAAMLKRWQRPHVSNHQKRRRKLHSKCAR